MANGAEEPTRICPYCGKEFKPKRKNQRFCDVGCSRPYHNARGGRTFPPKPCDRCGKEFQPKKGSEKFCSAECNYQQRNDGRLTLRLRKLDDILRAQGIDLSELEDSSIKAVRFWEQGYKDAEGKGQVQQLAGIQFSPAWESGPAWPVVQPGPAVKLSSSATRPKSGSSKDWRTAVVLPDMQIGYWRDPDTDELTPTHDEAAIGVVRSIVRQVVPDDIVMHGDNLDFPEFSKYRKTATFGRTTQEAINRATVLMAELRTDAPEARIVWLEGNHELRLPHFITDNAMAAFGLKRPGDDWPVLSVPFLCRLDEVGVEYLSGYPANHLWLNDNLRIVHGHKVNSTGTTAMRYLTEERVSVLYGHIHRREHVEQTRETRYGPRTVLAASFGCLCRIDGAVPSMKGGTDLFGRPVPNAENWQQGLGIVHYHPDGRFAIESVAIWNGWAMWRGQELTA